MEPTEAVQSDKRQDWLAFVFDEALKQGVLAPSNVLSHATPEVLAGHLPRELMVKVFATAFSTGKLTPEGILAVAPPATLVKYVTPAILWNCVREAAARQQVVAVAQVAKGKSPVRNWIALVIARAVHDGILTATDVVRHIPPREWVRDVPVEVVAKMIAAGLNRPNFDPAAVLDVLTPAVIGEFVAPHLSWAAIDEGALRAFRLTATAGQAGTSAAGQLVAEAALPA